jgi:hypothetical protein
MCPMPDPMPTAEPVAHRTPARECHTRFGIFPACPLCGGDLHPEHAHYKCGTCGWRDSCCD